MSRKEKLKELLVDEDETFTDIVEKVKHILSINKKDGTIYFKVSLDEISDKEAILLLLSGAKFAHELELRAESEVTNQEIIGFLNKTPNSISGAISKLKKEKKIISPNKGKHSVNPLAIVKDIDSILERLKLD